LVKNPAKRLGSGLSDAAEIKAHPFFGGIDWNSLLQLKITPPFFPTIVTDFGFYVIEN
jgi:hypothetical protein